MTLLQVLRSTFSTCGVRDTPWLIVGHPTGYMSNTWAGDPGGDKTGVATDAQNAGADAFIICEPDRKDPDFSRRGKLTTNSKSGRQGTARRKARRFRRSEPHCHQSHVDPRCWLPRHIYAGRIRPRRNRVVPGQGCLSHDAYQFSHLCDWLDRLLDRRVSVMYGAMPVASLGGTAGLDAAKEVVIELFGKPFGLFATNGWFLGGNVYDVGVFTIFLFQMVFMDTAATIPTGAMAERWKLSAFIVFGFFMSMILYPVFGNWAWGGGWLSQLGVNFGLGHGYADFAGSGVVHAVGGLCALAGAIVLGPRLGKYNRDGTINPMPAHHIPMALLGAFILAFGWFGFNPGSTLGVSGGGLNRVGIVAVATMLAGAGGAFSQRYIWS